jgi:hypothetical protein
MSGEHKICSSPSMVGDSPTTVSEPQAVEIAHTLPEAEETSAFLGFVAEPWAALVPVAGRTRLVSLSLAPKVRSDIPRKKRVPGKPTPFTTYYGDEIQFLPSNPVQKTSSVDLEVMAEYEPDVTGWIEAGVRRHGQKRFLLQIDRSRAYFRGSEFWRLRSGHDLTPKQDGYPVSWLRSQAERHPDGKLHGLIDETALLLAAQIEELVVFSSASGGWAITR